MTSLRATPSGEESLPAAALCAPFIDRLAITGASVCVFDSSGRQSTICATDDVASHIDELHLALGTGPEWEAMSSGEPVLVVDVKSALLLPALGVPLERLGVGALFALPMNLGAVTVGVVTLYRTTAGGLTSKDLRAAQALVLVTASRAVREALASAHRETGGAPRPAGPEMRREVHQATGMIMIQLDVNATEAFSRLRGHAFLLDRSLLGVARDVVAGTIDFRELD